MRNTSDTIVIKFISDKVYHSDKVHSDKVYLMATNLS